MVEWSEVDGDRSSIDYSSLVVSIVLIAHAFLTSLTALGCCNMIYVELNQSSEGSKSLSIVEREGDQTVD